MSIIIDSMYNMFLTKMHTREPMGITYAQQVFVKCRPSCLSVACEDPLLPRFLLLHPLPPFLHLSPLGVILLGLQCIAIDCHRKKKRVVWTFLSSPVLLGHSCYVPVNYFRLLTTSQLDFIGRLSCGGSYCSSHTREGVLCRDYATLMIQWVGDGTLLIIPSQEGMLTARLVSRTLLLYYLIYDEVWEKTQFQIAGELPFRRSERCSLKLKRYVN